MYLLVYLEKSQLLVSGPEERVLQNRFGCWPLTSVV